LQSKTRSLSDFAAALSGRFPRLTSLIFRGILTCLSVVCVQRAPFSQIILRRKELHVKKPVLNLSIVVALLAVGLLAACAPTTATSQPTAEATLEQPTVAPTSTSAAANAQPADENAITTASGLQYVEIEKGTGPAPQPGEVVVVNYRGTLEDGTEFDNSYVRGEPFQFALGQGMVIPGWDEGVALMHEGGKAKLIIPPDLAYGEAGAGSTIPPNATLIFEVELVSIQPGSPEAPTAVDEADYTTSPSGLKYYDLQTGDGPAVQEGDVVSIDFTAWLTDGTKIGSSIDTGTPVVFPAGRGQVIPGWDEGVLSMQVGGQRQLVIPSELAFGDQGSSGMIPPNATLIIELTLNSISPGSPAAPTEVDPADYTTTDSGLEYYDLKIGDGPSPEAGQEVTVQYTGWLTDGTKFDSSIDRGQPLTFPVGMGQVIPGWDEGVMSMKVGGQRQLVIPSDLGYGPDGYSGVIPPNATLIFEVELVDVK
jgi:peptidylprolyl isomerase